MTGLYKRRNVWWIRFTPIAGGKQARISTGKEDEAEAITEARKIMARESGKAREALNSCQGELDAYFAAQRRKGLAASTMDSRKYVLESFIEYVGTPSPRAISPDKIQRWFDAREEANVHTALAYLHIVRYWFAWLVDGGKLSRNPADAVKVPERVPMRHRKVFLLPDESRKFIASVAVGDFPKHLNGVKAQRAARMETLRFVLYSGLHAGLRKLEVVEARPDWFDLERKLLHIQPTATFEPKDRECRTIPLTDEFCAFLKEYTRKLPPNAPFMLAPEVRHGKYRYRYDFRKLFEEHAEACGMPHVTFHDLRRTFASQLVSAGVSIYKVAKWLGDLVEVVEETYGHLIPQDEQINIIASGGSAPRLDNVISLPAARHAEPNDLQLVASHDRIREVG